MMNYTQEKPNAQKKPRTQKRLQMFEHQEEVERDEPREQEGPKMKKYRRVRVKKKAPQLGKGMSRRLQNAGKNKE